MEVLIVSYVLQIRKDIGKGHFPFEHPYDNKSPKRVDLYQNYGVLVKKGTFDLQWSFDGFVTKCLENDIFLLKAIAQAVDITPKKISQLKKATKKDIFTSSDGHEIVVDNKLVTRYFSEHPSELSRYPDVVMVAVTPKFNVDEPIVQPLVDDMVPTYFKLAAERDAKKATEKKHKQMARSSNNSKKRAPSSSIENSRRSKKQKTQKSIRHTAPSHPGLILNLPQDLANHRHAYDPQESAVNMFDSEAEESVGEQDE